METWVKPKTRVWRKGLALKAANPLGWVEAEDEAEVEDEVTFAVLALFKPLLAGTGVGVCWVAKNLLVNGGRTANWVWRLRLDVEREEKEEIDWTVGTRNLQGWKVDRGLSLDSSLNAEFKNGTLEFVGSMTCLMVGVEGRKRTKTRKAKTSAAFRCFDSLWFVRELSLCFLFALDHSLFFILFFVSSRSRTE